MRNSSILLRLAERRQRSTEIITVLAKYGLAEHLNRELLASLEKFQRGRLTVSDPAATEMAAGERIRAALTELEAPLGELFAEFEPVARASASVAQVHDAVLHNGTQVVVKVVHQGADVRAREDLEIMTALAQLWENSRPAA